MTPPAARPPAVALRGALLPAAATAVVLWALHAVAHLDSSPWQVPAQVLLHLLGSAVAFGLFLELGGWLLGLAWVGTTAALRLYWPEAGIAGAAPAVAIYAGMAALFGRTLIGNAVPLITRLAIQAQGGTLSPELGGYSRRVTVVWTAFFILQGIAVALLAIAGPPHWWSWLANVALVPELTVLFVGEYWWRRHRYPFINHPSLTVQFAAIVRSRAWRKSDVPE